MPALHRLARPLSASFVVLVAIAGLVALARRADTSKSHATNEAYVEHGHAMDPAVMRREVAQWYASNPAHGGVINAPPAADTVLVISFRFDTDGSAGTQVDTVKIHTGESVLFKFSDGFHTTTSGNPGDLNAGSLWDAPITPSETEFQVDFPTPGLYPYHCRPHGQFFNMRGFVKVTDATVDVADGPLAARTGFVGAPSPNPTRDVVTFRFAVAVAGRGRAEVFDASGRRVAVAFDRELAAGVHGGAWDGRTAAGTLARAGVYYLRLDLPGARESRRIVLER